MVVTGQRKALTLSMAIEHGVNHLWTLSEQRMHPWALLVVGEDATAGMYAGARHVDNLNPGLHVETKYFRPIERVHEEVEASRERLAKKEAGEVIGSRRSV